MNVSVNFIISNAWLKGMKAVLDYDANKLRVPMQFDTKVFHLEYRRPMKKAPALKQGQRPIPKAAYMNLPIMDGLVSVMTMYHPNSPWMGRAKSMASSLRDAAATGVPRLMPSSAEEKEDPKQDGILRTGAASTRHLCP